MIWGNRRFLYRPNLENFSLVTHASMPVVYHLFDNQYRIYFSSRDQYNHSYINFIELDLLNPEKKRISEAPILSKGPLGHFDDNGVYSGPLLEADGELLMFYNGRSNGADNVYYMSIGLAKSLDKGATFTKFLNCPVFSRNKFDPWMVTAPAIYRDANYWRMVYTSGISINAQNESLYDLKMAVSTDLINWNAIGNSIIPLASNETNIATPTIIQIGKTFHMWFSVKQKRGEYKIGYAKSPDGLAWTRNDFFGLNNFPENRWECNAVSYPHVFQKNDIIYMVYCGNNNGKDGIGIVETLAANLYE